MLRKLKLPLAFLLLAATANAQIPEIRQPTDDPEKRRKQAVAFLRETLSDVGNLRTLENRISFTSELAGLMWYADENEARTMFGSVINDFRQLVMQLDGQMNSMGAETAEAEDDAGLMMFLGDPSDRSRLERKFRVVMAVRQQIAGSVAEHDAELAYSFYDGIGNLVTNAKLRENHIASDRYFEQQLLTKIADSDPTKAGNIGKHSLGKGFGLKHVELLKKLYEKDAEKGSEFAAAVLDRLKTEKLTEEDYSAVGALLSFGSEQIENGSKRLPFSRQEMREIADIMAGMILSQSGDDKYEAGISGAGHVDTIAKYSPVRAAQIRARFRKETAQIRSAGNAVNAAANAMNAAGRSVNAVTGAGNSAEDQRRQQAAEAQARREKEWEDVQAKLLDGKLPKTERENTVARARQIIGQMRGRNAKITALSALAAQVAGAGDKELASEIMRDAHSLVNPNPKNFQDFLLTWMLATGYAKADPEKAFSLLEDTIYRANQTLEAFVKVGEFIDVAEEMIQDGEVQVGAFGGSVVRGLTGELGMADNVIGVLVEADFNKTKALTNRFERPEVRIMAKMMVLQATLGKKPATPNVIPAEAAVEEVLNGEQ